MVKNGEMEGIQQACEILIMSQIKMRRAKKDRRALTGFI